MAETFDVHNVVVHLSAGDWAGDNVHGALFRAPADGSGGGITIIGAWAVNAAATGAGTGFGIALHNYGTGGTAIKSTGGTIAAEVGGTADPWAADTPKAFTISNAFVDAGEWVYADKQEDNSSDPIIPYPAKESSKIIWSCP